MRLILSTAILLALALPAVAQECVPSTSEPEVTLAERYLELSPGCQPNCEPGAPGGYVYEESNGLAGLQRDDEERDDTCGGAIAADAIVARILR